MKKKQILSETTPNAGRHNGRLAESTSRVIRGGTWKRQRVVLVVPAGDLIPARVYLSHCCLIFPPNQPAHRMLALGHEVGEAYSSAVESVLAHPDLSQWEYVCTLEHDNIPPQDGLLKLIKRLEEHPELSAVSGLYWTKGEGGQCQRWGDPTDSVLNFRPMPPPAPGELGECCGIGMGFGLFRMELFRDKRLPRPLFRTKAGRDGVGTQDLMFWAEARKYGHRCGVDAGVLVGHYDFEGKHGIPDIIW